MNRKSNLKINIKKSITADTRSADKIVTKDELLASSKQHINDVRSALFYIRQMLSYIGCVHDYTKINDIDSFYRDFHEAQTNDDFNFIEGEWFQKHITEERHHINNHCKDDINLYDVLEMIADCVMAGMARTGTVYDIEISNEILQKAVKNTVEDLKKNTIVKEEEK